MEATKKCSKCNQDKALIEFYEYKKSGRRKSECKSCSRAYYRSEERTARRTAGTFSKKAYIALAGKECRTCGAPAQVLLRGVIQVHPGQLAGRVPFAWACCVKHMKEMYNDYVKVVSLPVDAREPVAHLLSMDSETREGSQGDGSRGHTAPVHEADDDEAGVAGTGDDRGHRRGEAGGDGGDVAFGGGGAEGRAEGAEPVGAAE